MMFWTQSYRRHFEMPWLMDFPYFGKATLAMM